MKTTRIITPLAAILFTIPFASISRGSPIIWNGPTIEFTKAPFANETLAVNQDRISDTVWLTRGSVQGILNAKTELFYTHNLSPAGTEWALGTTANYSSLTYTNWETWTGGIPNVPNIVGKNAVVHLIADDIYLDLKFTSWGVGSTAGGSFSYQRSTAPVPEPASLALLGVGASFISSRRARRGS
jgi:hypothetical protein